MELKIYYDGKLDRKNEMKWAAKRAFWTTYVWLDCYGRNKRFPSTANEREAARDIALSFATGERRPF